MHIPLTTKQNTNDMATLATTTEGFNMVMLSKSEQDYIWMQLDQNISPVATGEPCYTPRDNKKYYWLSDTETSFEKYEAVLMVNGKKIKVKYNLLNQHEKINAAVRKAYNN